MTEERSSEVRGSVGPYKLLERAGRGGMSTVYKARDTRTQEIFAVKIASRSVTNDPYQSRRFELEFEVARELDHPNLIKLFDYQIDNGLAYLVMEYVDGDSLLQHLKAKPRLDEAEALAIFVQIAEGLGYLHDRQIVHRDVKPANVLLTSQGRAKLIDLGLSKNLESVSGLTRSNIGLGTMQFAAPEQFDDARSADARSDIYSLAATLYLALTGELPFGTGGSFNVLARKMKNDFAPAISKNPNIRACVDAAIRLGLQEKRDRRPASCREFVAILTGTQAPPAIIDVAETSAPVHEKILEVPKPSGPERRASIRYTTDFESNCRPLMGSKQRWQAIIKDISTTGTSLLVKRRFEIGNMLDISLVTQADGTSTTQVGCVKRITQADGGAWVLGCEFLSAISQEELDHFFCERIHRTEMT